MTLPLIISFAAVFLLALVPVLSIALLLKQRGLETNSAIAITAMAGTCLIGYAIFWMFFGALWLGWTAVAIVYAASAFVLARNRASVRALCLHHELQQPLLLMAVLGLFYIGILCLYSKPRAGIPSDVAAHRFNDLPIDNVLPNVFANFLEQGEKPRHLFGSGKNDWLGSDRPPLQTGVILLLRPPLRLAGLHREYLGFSASVWFQLLWIPALWSLLRQFTPSRTATLVILATGCTGFSLLYSVFTWPKFGAAALIIGATSLILQQDKKEHRFRWYVAAVMLGLAHLSHGGSDFAIITLLPACLLLPWRPRPAELVSMVVIMGVLAAPWVAYQQFYDPPGNRLLKMHLAGVNDVDDRGFAETLVASYKNAGIMGVLENKRANLSRLIEGDFSDIFNYKTDTFDARRRRDEEFFFFIRALGIVGVAFLLSPIALFLLNCRKKVQPRTIAVIAAYLAWCIATLLVWCILMFPAGSTVIHQGSLVPVLAVFSLVTLIFYQLSPWLFGMIATVQLLSFLATWLPANPAETAKIDALAAAVCIASFALFAGALAKSRKDEIL